MNELICKGDCTLNVHCFYVYTTCAEMTLFGPLVESLSTLIASCVDTGSVKVRFYL